MAYPYRQCEKSWRFTTAANSLVRLLLDQNLPRALGRLLPGHDVVSAADMGWEELSNGELLSAAEEAGFAAMLTADQNIRYPQNLNGRRLALAVPSTNHWPTPQAGVGRVLEALTGVGEGSYVAVNLPRSARR